MALKISSDAAWTPLDCSRLITAVQQRQFKPVVTDLIMVLSYHSSYGAYLEAEFDEDTNTFNPRIKLDCDLLEPNLADDICRGIKGFRELVGKANQYVERHGIESFNKIFHGMVGASIENNIVAIEEILEKAGAGQ